MTVERKHDGLSPSSLTQFIACQKKYYFRKIAKYPYDPDVSEDVEALQVGKAFHKCLEDTKHVLDGYKYSQCKQVVADHGLTDSTHAPLIMTMLKAYKSMHEKAGLKAIAFEVPIDTKEFYGIVDVVLESKDGWFIGDMKTAASYVPGVVPTFARHPQLSLYAYHHKELAKTLSLDPDKYMGCRYRMITKSKMARKEGESDESYMGRISKTVKALDFVIPKERMEPEYMASIHLAAKEFIDNNAGHEQNFQRNYSSCYQYFRPCEYYSKCHGHQYTTYPELECVSSD